jgi:glycosyltransferase involved in cell wall biosynthesis
MNPDRPSSQPPQNRNDTATRTLPSMSVVTCSYNQGKFLEETITSVLNQNYPKLQYIVIDGGSTDNSVEIIKKYANRLDYWISEKDNGQSQAVNKGIAHCTGEIFSWINSDDVMAPGALHAVARAWMQEPNRIIAGHTDIFNSQGSVEIMKARGMTLRNFVRFWEAPELGWCQPSTFVPLKMLVQIGALREDLHHAMDYVMLTELMARGVQVGYVDQVLSRFRLHADSKTVAAKAEQSMERISALRSLKNIPVKVTDAEWNAETARRLIELARRDLRGGRYGASFKTLGQAFVTSPGGTIGGVFSRVANLAKR